MQSINQQASKRILGDSKAHPTSKTMKMSDNYDLKENYDL